MPPQYQFALALFVFGAAIGSFLNVCIYRMPRNLSVNDPVRSFCPRCHAQIAWWNNLPLFSWLFLRGRCASCQAPIPFRYFGVELLTALLFVGVGMKAYYGHLWLAIPYCILVCLLVVATFIDIEFFIIPDEITLGGVGLGVGLAFIIPGMHGEAIWWKNGVWAVIGAAAGYALLRTVVELGKLAFGKRRLRYDTPQAMTWVRRGDEADLKIGGEEMLWSDFFARGNEELHMVCRDLAVDGEKVTAEKAVWTLDWLHVGDRRWKLEETGSISGEVTEVVLPREAMGLGDVKFIAAIGAFLGWRADFFTVVSASMAGALIGTLGLLLHRRGGSAKIYFGPYLALGALLWIFAGPELLEWYWNLAFPAAAP